MLQQMYTKECSMGCFKKLYDKNYVEPEPQKTHWSDVHDYWNEIDEGYLTD